MFIRSSIYVMKPWAKPHFIFRESEINVIGAVTTNNGNLNNNCQHVFLG
jgi:hypothetical protein